jgi:leucyl aminopeptidase
MNLKPGDSMSTMKEDMSGAAAVASAIYAIATAELPVHVIGLMPATDNRPGPKAIVPGDIIKMQSGLTVEVLNTDAEGRLILADALSYAKKYTPSLVIDLATLTGSAIRAVGRIGIVAMQIKASKDLEQLKESGMETYERIVEFPTWDEYGEGIKSEVADIKNVGPAEAGAITAGKFLEKFTDYPYIHLDIAGPAFLDKRDSYRGQGGTGVGVRLLFDFIKKQAKQKT